MAAFTTIATGIGLAATAATTGASFAQAGKQKKMQRQAEAEADKALQEARKKLDVNFYEQLGINKEVYELEREALLSSGAQAIEAGVESERGAAAVAGRVQMAQTQEQQAIRAAQEKEMLELDKLVAGEEGRLLDVGAQLNLEEVAGAQMAAAAAEEQKAMATQQAIQGIGSLAQQAVQAAPLYSKAGVSTQRKAVSGLTSDSFSTEEKADFLAAGLDYDKFIDTCKMSNSEYRKWRSDLTPEQQALLFRSKQYTENLDKFMNPFYYYR